MWYSLRNRIKCFTKFPIRKPFHECGGSGSGGVGAVRNNSEATIQLDSNSFKLFKLDSGPATEVKLNKADAENMLLNMITVRRIENGAAALYKDKVIRGFCHLYIGQEAIAAGVKQVLRPVDNVITAYRCHGWCYVMGIPPVGILAELTGRHSGCARGKGGSMHMYGQNFFGGNGIVGAQVGLGTGIAFANKYRGDGGVCITCYGDGAANQGQVFESYNMACLWKLPIVYVCENNLYGLGTRAERAACDTGYYTRGAYLSGLWVDGMNCLAVRSATEFAIKYVLENKPLVIEFLTYRYMGHSMSDPGTSYRTREEVQEVREKRDAINAFKEVCKSNNLLTDEEIKAIETKVKAEVEAAATTARSDTEIELKELYADIYSNNLEPAIRNATGYSVQHIQINKGANH